MHQVIRLILCCLALAAPAAASADAAALARNCALCHGLAGSDGAGLIPLIGGQREAYLKQVLTEFRQGKRPTLFMGRLAKGYTDQELAEVATHYARLDWSHGVQTTDPRLVERGMALARERCAACHGGTGGPGSETAPLIAGQWAAYLRGELEKYLDPRTPPTDPGMRDALAGLGGADIEALAQFYASLR